jgi:hypothetical protein
VVKRVAFPEVPIVFADSRKFGEEWTYRYLSAALAEAPPDELGSLSSEAFREDARAAKGSGL